MGSSSQKQCSGYNDRSVVGSAFSGIAQGFAGMVGLGGFWNPVSDNQLKDLSAQFQHILK